MKRFVFKRYLIILASCLLLIGIAIPVTTFAKVIPPGEQKRVQPTVRAQAVAGQPIPITADCSSPQTLTTLNIGDIFNASATLTSGDPNEESEGETLQILDASTNPPTVLLNLDVNTGSATINPFTATVNKDPIQACIVGIDQDETGTVTFTVTPPSKHQQLFVVLQGINTSLSADDVADNGGYGVIPDFEKTVFEGPRGHIHILGIVPYLKAHGFGSAQFLAYSYAGSDGKGHPSAYACVSTFTQPLDTDVILLGRQIVAALTHNPALKGKPTDVYLIGHSLGGVVAFGYLAALFEKSKVSVPSLPSGDSLKSVITLDSPIGGVSDDPRYFNAISTGVKYFTGCGVPPEKLVTVRNLINVFKTTFKPTFPPPDDGKADPQGSHASILKGLLGGAAETNQGVAEDAATAHSTSVLTIGNTSDILWQLGVCDFPRIDFISTQWVEDEQGELAVYGRDFTEGNVGCANLITNQANHKEVYNNSDVETALTQFLPNGGVPAALTVAPPGP